MEVKTFLRIMKLRREIDSALVVAARNTEECVRGSNRLAGELALKASERLTALLKELIEESGK